MGQADNFSAPFLVYSNIFILFEPRFYVINEQEITFLLNELHLSSNCIQLIEMPSFISAPEEGLSLGSYKNWHWELNRNFHSLQSYAPKLELWLQPTAHWGLSWQQNDLCLIGKKIYTRRQYQHWQTAGRSCREISQPWLYHLK